MSRFIGIIYFSIVCYLFSFSQDSICIIKKGQLLKYRQGFIITVKNDTIRGLIYHESDTGIMFINGSRKIKTTLLGKLSKIPYISSKDNIVKLFYRKGILYERCKIPPDSNWVFLAVLENGPLKLYAEICNYADKRTTDAMMNQQMLGILFGALTTEANDDKDLESEYFDIHAYYFQKEHTNNLIYAPKGEHNFQKVFLPLVRDNKNFVKNLSGQSVNYFQIRSLVKQYNSFN